MGKKLYVRNLNDLIDSDTLEEMFSAVGTVMAASVEVKQVRGNDYRVGYVEMTTEQEAVDSIDRFHGQKCQGLVLVVTEDKPHVPVPVLTKKQAAAAAKARAL
jgi:RNA recognition motif-containing protein